MWSNRELAAEVEAILKDKALDHWSIVLHNDDINTFDWVIECLVKYCGHELIQAEQCAYFVHHKGMYTVKYGDKFKLKPICDTLLEKGLNATLEKQNHE
jgi:ATP-dependent Clp protease adaptor protein ClpS